MNEFEAPSLLADEFPEVYKELRHLAVLGNVYESMNILSSFTREKIAAHQFRQVQHCMKIADDIYNRGNKIVRNAVENVFVYSFTLMRASCNKVEWRFVQATIPSRLFLIYMHQVNRSAS